MSNSGEHEMDIVDLIKSDHDELAELFDHLAEVARDDRRTTGAESLRACAHLVVAAHVHARAEERVLYEALRTAGGHLKAFALAGPHEHENLDITLDKLLLHRASEELVVIARVARDLFEMHAREEEEIDILPLILTELAPEDREALARDMVAEKARIRPQIARMVALPARAA
jgi:hypothetical protein